jgi:hypothetical protein
VEGFCYQASQLDSGADLAVSEGAHHTFLLLAVSAWILLHSGVAIVPGSYCIVLTVLDYCSTSYIHHISKLVFPGGGLSRVI